MPRINLRHERPHMGRQPAGRTSYIRSDGTRQHHRLTREERAKCRSLYQEGMDKEEIATEIDCAEPTVTRAVNNEYAHPDNLESDEDYLPSPSRLKPAIPVHAHGDFQCTSNHRLPRAIKGKPGHPVLKDRSGVGYPRQRGRPPKAARFGGVTFMDKAVYNRDRSDSPRSRKAADAVALDLTGSSDDDKVASDPAQPIIDLLQSRRLPLDVFLPALKRCDVVDHESLLMLATDVDSDLIDGMLKEHIGSGKYNVVQVQVFKTALRKLVSK